MPVSPDLSANTRVHARSSRRGNQNPARRVWEWEKGYSTLYD